MPKKKRASSAKATARVKVSRPQQPASVAATVLLAEKAEREASFNVTAATVDGRRGDPAPTPAVATRGTAAAPPAPAASDRVNVNLDVLLQVMRNGNENELNTPQGVCTAFFAALKDQGIELNPLDLVGEQPVQAQQVLPDPVWNIFTFKPTSTDSQLYFWEPDAPGVKPLKVLFLNSAMKGSHMDRLAAGWSPKFVTGVATEIAQIDATQVVVLHGESGSGKTLTAMLSARKHLTSGVGALCVCIIPADVGPMAVDPPDFTVDGRFAKPRDLEFERVLFGRIETKLGAMWNFLAAESKRMKANLAGTAPKGHVTVLFDEFGRYSEAIRTICGARENLVLRIRTKLRLGDAVTVQIIIAGTGVQGATHMVGSLPEKFHLRTVAPLVWKELRPKAETATTPSDAFAAAVCDAVDKRESRAANTAWRMVSTNARACAVFLNQVFLLEDGGGHLVSPKLLRGLVASTSAVFKSLNGLAGVTQEEYRRLYFRAVALSLYGPKVDPFGSSELSTCFNDYGMVTDRAVLVKKAAQPDVLIATRGDGNELCLPACCNGQRYYLSEAQIVIAQTVLGLGDREYSGEGFEELVADLLVHAAMVAPWLKGQDLLQPLTHSRPWVHTLDLLAELVKSSGETTTVMRARLKQRIEPTTKGGRIGDTDIITQAAGKRVDAVLLNADKAAFADLFFKQGRGPKELGKVTLWLVQIKRYESTVLTADATMEELFKMGDLRDWPQYMIRKIRNEIGDPTQLKPWLGAVNEFLKPECKSVSVPFEPFQTKSAPSECWGALETWLKSQIDRRTTNAMTPTQKIAGPGCDLKRVVFVWGKPPADVQPQLPPDTLLVHAWDPDPKVLRASPALGGLYPFSHKDADFAILKLPIDRPAAKETSSSADTTPRA